MVLRKGPIVKMSCDVKDLTRIMDQVYFGRHDETFIELSVDDIKAVVNIIDALKSNIDENIRHIVEFKE